MIKAILFDADGVAINNHRYFSQRFSEDFNVPMEKIIPFLKEDSININFLWNGSANELVSLLERTKIVNLLVEEPDLEEIFLHYYKNED
jgi:ABC-2 type transport system ATP-binding protein